MWRSYVLNVEKTKKKYYGNPIIWYNMNRIFNLSTFPHDTNNNNNKNNN